MPPLIRAFGLTIESSGPIPGLTDSLPQLDPTGAPFEPDLRICLEPDAAPEEIGKGARLVHESEADGVSDPLRVWYQPPDKTYRFAFDDGAQFQVDATSVRSCWPPSLTLEDSAVYLLGSILGFVLRLRGTVCLHASAATVDEHAIAVVAPAGRGKSTTAAAFALRGLPVLTDDILALTERNGGFVVEPGYPRVRLWPPAVEALFGAADALPRITPHNPDWDKRYLDLASPGFAFGSEPAPLAAIYTGFRDDDADAPYLTEMEGSEAVMTLVANSYSRKMLDAEMRARDFDVLNRLAGRVAVKSFGIRQGIEHLGELCDLLLDDCRSSAGTHAALAQTTP